MVDHLQRQDQLTVISFWKGHIVGAGVGLTFRNKFKIVTETATFSLPETQIYLGTDISALSFMPTFDATNLPRALYIALTMQRIKGEQIVRHGLATHFVPSGRIDDLKAHLALHASPAITDNQIESIINSYSTLRHSKGLERTLADFSEINQIFQPDSVEGIILRAKDSETPFGRKCYNQMDSTCRLGLQIAFRMLTEAYRKLSEPNAVFSHARNRQLCLNLVHNAFDHGFALRAIEDLLLRKKQPTKIFHKV